MCRTAVIFSKKKDSPYQKYYGKTDEFNHNCLVVPRVSFFAKHFRFWQAFHWVIEIEKAKTQVAGNEMLAALERKLLEAEFGRRAAETEKKITKQFIERQAVKDDTVTMVAESEDERLKKYLKSSRVRNLLAPFCAKGFCEPVAGVGFRRNDSLTKVPMSISKIAIQGTLSPNQGNMKNLIAIATNPDNDRPAWSINYTNYADDEDDFENMDGEKVNRYVEAQRILREHGLELVELGIMRN